MRFFGCNHDWIVIAKTYMDPAPDVEADWLDAEIAERCRAGVTTVLMTCNECGKKNVTEMLGKEIP